MAGIQKADPGARRVALAIVVFGGALGAALLALASGVRDDFEAWAKEDLEVRGPMLIAALAVAISGPAIGMAGYLWRVGQRTARARRYPPPGLSVVQDTAVIEGEPAVRRARLVQTCAAVIAVAGLLAAFFLWRVLSLLEGRGT